MLIPVGYLPAGRLETNGNLPVTCNNYLIIFAA